jgi:phosphoglycolate phosphatase-like HAD superfamily hydrolase
MISLPSAILWDLDGVLIDTGRFHYQSWADTLLPAGHAFPPETFRATFGMNNQGVLSAVFGRAPTPAELSGLADRKEALFRDMIAGQAEALPGVEAWLRRLKAAGYRQAVASSAPAQNIDVMIDALHLRPYFDSGGGATSGHAGRALRGGGGCRGRGGGRQGSGNGLPGGNEH